MSTPDIVTELMESADRYDEIFQEDRRPVRRAQLMREAAVLIKKLRADLHQSYLDHEDEM